MVTTVLCCVLSDPWGCRCASKHRRQLILVQAFLTVAALACVLTAALAGNSLHAHAVTSLPWVLWYVDDDATYEYDVGSVNASHAPTFAARESSVVQEHMDADATNISGKYSLGFRHACLDRDERGTGDRADDNGCFTHDVMEDTFYAFNDNHHSFHAAHTLMLLKTLLEASSGRKVIIPELQGPEPLFVTHAYRARDGTNFACSPSTTSVTPAGVSWSWPATIANCTQVYSKERHSFEAGFQGHHLYHYVRRSVTVPVNVTVPLEWYTLRGELLYAENSTLLTTCIPNQPEGYGCESVDVLLGAFRKQFDDCDVRQDLCNDYWRHPQAREPVAIPPTHPQPTPRLVVRRYYPPQRMELRYTNDILDCDEASETIRVMAFCVAALLVSWLALQAVGYRRGTARTDRGKKGLLVWSMAVPLIWAAAITIHYGLACSVEVQAMCIARLAGGARKRGTS